MKRFLLVLFLWCSHVNAQSEPLRFEPPLTITTAANGVFIHLDASGRRSIAVSGNVVGVVWEDNRSGKPGIYIAYYLPDKSGFTQPEKISLQSSAYEPVIMALDEQRFLAAWEEDEHVWLRVLSPSKKGDVVSIGQAPAKQISVAADNRGNTGAVWSGGPPRNEHIYYSDLKANAYTVLVSPPQLVDTSNDKDVQSYPVLAFSEPGKIVAWEDRRHGHTRIFSAFAPKGQPFQRYQPLNEFDASPNPELGKGSGAMRPVLASNNSQLAVAAWMDKRNWQSGYDVFAAVSENGGAGFGGNEQVQDMFGENVPQWHAAAALHGKDGIAAVAWDDTRNENSDVFYSLRTQGKWSDDYELTGATGPGHQSHPSIVFDGQGRLHVVWLDNAGGHISLRYARSLR
ncbi:MAG: hypothetical protein L0Z73_12410 [Gammaproteobacteria bacterium]|nr:hypothetical protein [Gammaproteobacteria bacterium]